METYLPLLLDFSQPLEVTKWLPEVLQHYRGVTINLEQALTHPDIHFVNEPTETLKIEQVRTLQELSSYNPYQLPLSIFVMQNLETASVAAQNALLKILEEPPATVCLILTTQNRGKILPTIQSRCHLIFWENSSAETPFESPDLLLSETIYHQVMAANYGELITLTDTYADRTQAMQLITKLSWYLHQQLQLQVDQPQASMYLQQLQVLLKTSTWLEKNVNLKLALAECFFQLHAKQPILRP